MPSITHAVQLRLDYCDQRLQPIQVQNKGRDSFAILSLRHPCVQPADREVRAKLRFLTRLALATRPARG